MNRINRKEYLYYRVRYDVEPGSLKDVLVRNSYKCLDYKMVLGWRRIKYILSSKIQDMRRSVRDNKNYKINTKPKKLDNCYVAIILRDKM